MELSVLESVLLYITIVILSTVLMGLAEKGGSSQKIYLILAFLVITLPSALRYDVGIDYLGYIDMYNVIVRSGSLADIPQYSIEYSFRVLSLISYILIGSPQLLFAVYAALTNFFILLGIYFYRKETKMSTMMFMYSCLFFFLTMNITRQMLAVSIIFFASKYIINKSFLKYLLFVLLAVFFHKSAIIALVLYSLALDHVNIKKIIRVIKYILPVIILFFMNYLITLFDLLINLWDPYKKYSLTYQITSDMTIGSGFMAMLIICLLFYNNYKQGLLRSSEKFQYFTVQITILATIFFLTEYRLANFGGRVSLYFQIFIIIALSMLARSGSRPEEGLRYDYQVVPYVYAILLFALDLVRDAQGCLPYSLWIGH
ncbi:EpsG family protein [Desulfosporosinus meridiei]|uniref:EpsG family protein n=1 Tax=Desulfosporosinus meridiei (strain ATCC BAA-275 / DSM 13257 / KCTC 12902 / NCIMB 13706 / S10) TaxID=768704 RepID=J7IVV9_DESMD|nr:EpsG family protein [Desulfosporosinus meridiei]AFQ45972.1 hypothetical protein Desmer_4143 [Desulfosporosinus meridiei DSM 13257]